MHIIGIKHIYLVALRQGRVLVRVDIGGGNKSGIVWRRGKDKVFVLNKTFDGSHEKKKEVGKVRNETKEENEFG